MVQAVASLRKHIPSPNMFSSHLLLSTPHVSHFEPTPSDNYTVCQTVTQGVNPSLPNCKRGIFEASFLTLGTRTYAPQPKAQGCSAVLHDSIFKHQEWLLSLRAFLFLAGEPGKGLAKCLSNLAKTFSAASVLVDLVYGILPRLFCFLFPEGGKGMMMVG